MSGCSAVAGLSDIRLDFGCETHNAVHLLQVDVDEFVDNVIKIHSVVLGVLPDEIGDAVVQHARVQVGGPRYRGPGVNSALYRRFVWFM